MTFFSGYLNPKLVFVLAVLLRAFDFQSRAQKNERR